MFDIIVRERRPNLFFMLGVAKFLREGNKSNSEPFPDYATWLNLPQPG